MLTNAQQVLKQYYGYEEFRPGQAKVIGSLLSGREVLAIMPTGAGKSICFQVPALLLPGITLVVSPLISLMKDQVDALQEQGIAATYINSSLTGDETRLRLREMAAGRYKIVYAAPERLELSSFQALLRRLEVSMVAIDEAHCVSQWGHDFRPSYRNITPFIASMPRRPLVGAFTATATPEVREDIVASLALNAPDVYVTGFDRPNLSFAVHRSINKQKFVLEYLGEHADEAGIIYASTRREVEEVHAFLQQRGWAAGRYHAGLTEQERSRAQEQFLYDDIQVMVATNAFGMGIDKPDVRYVIHYNMPRHVEAYYQEAGRSGRDGEPGECILLFSPQDTAIQRFLIQKSVDSPERRQQELRKLQDMVDYCHTRHCLRRYILRYFGQAPERDDCGNCGSCVTPRISDQVLTGKPPEPVVKKSAKRKNNAVSEEEDELFESLRQLRREISQREKIPPYVVFADSTLREMCLRRPFDMASLRRIKGVGEVKLDKYGSEFLECIREYIGEQDGIRSKQGGAEDALADGSEEKTHLVTLALFRQGLSPGEIARRRGLSLYTLQKHLVKCQQEGYHVDWQ